MDFISAEAIEYSEAYSSAQEALLQELWEQTLRDHQHSNMMSSPVQGKLLTLICRLLQPLKVLEIGTFTGFSALSMAAGMPEEAKLHTIELRDEDADTARSFFVRSAHANRIVQHRGHAIDIIPTLSETWDLVFIDADKTGYIDYYELTLPKLRKGGLIIADNVLFHGEVFAEEIKGKNAKAIHEFNRHVAADTRTEQVMLTVRDGLSIIRKL